MVSHHGSKKGVRHHGAKHGAKPKQGKYSMPLIGILVLAFLVIGSVVWGQLSKKIPKKHRPAVDFSVQHHYTLRPADVVDGQWVRIKQGVTIDRAQVLAAGMYVSFWATHGWQYWCLEEIFASWPSASPPGDDSVKQITPKDYDEFESSKDRSKKIFESVDADGNGYIEGHELHPEIIKALEAKDGKDHNDDGRLSHEELDSLISHHLVGDDRLTEDTSIDEHIADASSRARELHIREL